ncbi:MAG: DNA primase [Candidatus Aminicenantes bacterium]|nr:DNA primase [Candidatus Aminicenantes bacterium]
MEILDQVRNASSIVELVGQYTALRQRGKKYVGLCPFHSEKTPSFTVDAEKGLYHCFGCGVGGDVFTIVMEKENLAFPEALAYLAEKYHIPIPEKRRLSPQALKLEEQLRKIMESALSFFKKNLRETAEGKKALDYLKTRGLSEGLIEEFQLGYAPNSWNALTGYFKAKGVAPNLLENAGLVLPGRKAGEFYDRFRGRAIFPIFTMTGKVVGFGGRSLFNQEPKYLNSPDTPLYSKGHLLYGLNVTKDAIRDAGEFILVEGYTDFLSLYQAGRKNVVASLGTALTPHQVGLAMRFAPKAVINYDGDAAGQTAAFRAVPLFFEKGVETRVLVLPENLDPDGFLKNKGTAAYDILYPNSVSGLKFVIDYVSREKRLDVPEVKTKVLRSVMDVVDTVPDAFVRSEYLRLTAEQLGVDETLLRSLSRGKPDETAAPPPETFLPAEKRLLQILMEGDDLRPGVFAKMNEEDVAGLKSGPIFAIMLGLFEKNQDFNLSEMQKSIGPGLSREFSQALLEKGDTPSLEEALDCLCALRIAGKESEIRRVQAEIAREEKSGERTKLDALMNRKLELTRQVMALK